MEKRYNSKPILLSEGEAYLDGVKFQDCIKLEIKTTLGTWQGRKLGDRHWSSRTTSAKHSGVITERRNTPWTRQVVQNYLKTGKTSEFTITGRLCDADSDYYSEYGAETVTCIGCVMTGDINHLNFDSDSEDVLTDTININIYDIQFN